MSLVNYFSSPVSPFSLCRSPAAGMIKWRFKQQVRPLVTYVKIAERLSQSTNTELKSCLCLTFKAGLKKWTHMSCKVIYNLQMGRLYMWSLYLHSQNQLLPIWRVHPSVIGVEDILSLTRPSFSYTCLSVKQWNQWLQEIISFLLLEM